MNSKKNGREIPSFHIQNGFLVIWSVGKGEKRFQTNSPLVAKELARKVGFRCVATWVLGKYGRIFGATMSDAKAVKLLINYTRRFQGENRQLEAV